MDYSFAVEEHSIQTWKMIKDVVGVDKHGVVVDQKKSKIKCNYCCKVVSYFNRLKHHFGGVGGDVTPCLEALVHF